MTEVEQLVVPEFKMSSGTEMSVQQIDCICRQSYTPIIFMAGEIGSGKTTLIGSIHDAFLFGPVGEFQFAGSRTLLAFEERCFDSRAKSRGNVPETIRTRLESGQGYFHLAVQATKENKRYNLLFADMSGEFYERSLHSTAEISNFRDLRRSQVLLLLLDGSKLAQKGTRQTVRGDAISFLQRCIGQKLLRQETSLQILISKWDEVQQLSVQAQAETLAFVSSRLNKDLLKRQIQVVPIASRPGLGHPEQQKLFGIRELFPGWVTSIPSALRTSGDILMRPMFPDTSFGRFAGLGVQR